MVKYQMLLKDRKLWKAVTYNVLNRHNMLMTMIMIGHLTFTEVQNVSNNRSVNFTLSEQPHCNSQSSSSSLEVKF